MRVGQLETLNNLSGPLAYDVARSPPMDVFPILSSIVHPVELHRLNDKQLADVVHEVRNAILEKVSRTGGHFSSNLGTVELTVALYASYKLPPDKVVWDTGHQAYPHKLLTGRLARFDSLRKHKGISGFLRREEHELDVFGAAMRGRPSRRRWASRWRATNGARANAWSPSRAMPPSARA
jgi:hypothetical protein